MDFLTCCLINGPFLILNIMANVFYAFCIVCPLQGERIKQPLKLLLGSLIFCTITYLISVTFQLFFSKFISNNFDLIIVSYLVSVYSLCTNIKSSVWLNFYYFTQIVPSQRAVCMWIKKNIKAVICCIWFVERSLTLFEIGAMSNHFDFNVTIYNESLYLKIPGSKLHTPLGTTLIAISSAHFLLCLCVKVMSSSCTVVYLCRHMSRMRANAQPGQPVICPRTKSQVRVTVTGILQGVLFVICAVWITYSYISPTPQSQYTYFTVINLYVAGTTLNLGAGQAVFRQRIKDILLRAAQLCNVPKVKQSEQQG